MSSSRRLWAILWLSVVGLYVELLLIRWIGTEIRIFAYLQNTILVVCFLGLGAGFFTSRRPPWPLFGLANLGLLVVLLSVPLTRSILALTSTYLAAFGDFYIWFPEESARPIHDIACGLLMTAFVMAIVVNVFLPVGRALGRWMDEAGKPLVAYSVNVAGSLVGTWLFVVLGVFGLPPWTWFLVLGLLLLPVVFAHRRPWLTGALAFLPLVATFVAGRVDQGETVWSPYQKLVFIRNANLNNTPGIGMVTVNNVGYMALIDLRPTADHSNRALYPPELEGLSQYDLPTLLHPHPDDVLIVGAGAGNDVAGALRNGATSVTAVEIDPSIIEFGRRYHPEHPYDDPRVSIVNDDARAFFANTTRRFDVISFGLLDSHTTSVLTNTRLDHYVYTVESLKQARRLLREGGVLTLS